MAYDPEENARIHELAYELIQQGYSRRRIDSVLKKQFGRSIGKSTHYRLYQQGKQETKKTLKEEAPPRKLKRATRYKDPNKEMDYVLRANKFLPWERWQLIESLQLGKNVDIKDLNEVFAMIEERRVLWKRFMSKTRNRVYSANMVRSEWEKFVKRWYDKEAPQKYYTDWERRYAARLGRGNIPYKDLLNKWYGNSKKQIPKEQQWDTPRQVTGIRKTIKKKQKMQDRKKNRTIAQYEEDIKILRIKLKDAFGKGNREYQQQLEAQIKLKQNTIKHLKGSK